MFLLKLVRDRFETESGKLELADGREEVTRVIVYVLRAQTSAWL